MRSIRRPGGRKLACTNSLHSPLSGHDVFRPEDPGTTVYHGPTYTTLIWCGLLPFSLRFVRDRSRAPYVCIFGGPILPPSTRQARLSSCFFPCPAAEKFVFCCCPSHVQHFEQQWHHRIMRPERGRPSAAPRSSTSKCTKVPFVVITRAPAFAIRGERHERCEPPPVRAICPILGRFTFYPRFPFPTLQGLHPILTEPPPARYKITTAKLLFLLL